MLPRSSFLVPRLVWRLGSFLFYILLFLPHFLGAQEEIPCGTPDLNPAEYQARLQWFEENRTTVAGNTEYQIPIWLYIIRDDEGNSKFGSLSPLNYINQINALFRNSNYPDKLQFYLCGITFINSTAWTSGQTHQIPSVFSRY